MFFFFSWKLYNDGRELQQKIDRIKSSIQNQTITHQCDVDLVMEAGKKITKGIAANLLTKSSVVSVNIPCIPWRIFSRDSAIFFH